MVGCGSSTYAQTPHACAWCVSEMADSRRPNRIAGHYSSQRTGVKRQPERVVEANPMPLTDHQGPPEGLLDVRLIHQSYPPPATLVPSHEQAFRRSLLAIRFEHPEMDDAEFGSHRPLEVRYRW